MALLHQIGDLERLVNRVRGGQANPKELVALRRSLEVIPEIGAVLAEAGAPERLTAQVQPCDEVTALIAAGAGRRSAGQPGRWRRHPAGLLRGPGPAARRVQGCQAVPGQPGAAGAGADGHQVAQGRLQPGLRLLHRGQPGQHVPQVPADYIRKQTLTGARALLHHGAEGV